MTVLINDRTLVHDSFKVLQSFGNCGQYYSLNSLPSILKSKKLIHINLLRALYMVYSPWLHKDEIPDNVWNQLCTINTEVIQDEKTSHKYFRQYTVLIFPTLI